MQRHHTPSLAFSVLLRTSTAVLLFSVAAILGSCALGGAIKSYRYNSERSVAATYTGLENKTFAVLVSADRAVQTEHSDLLPQLTLAITERLRQHANASGFVPAGDALQYQYNNPRWAAMSYAELADEFGVERLLVVDLQEHRIREPGNSYVWNGRLLGTVGVVEADGAFPDEFAFSQQIGVKFPDTDGYGPLDYNDVVVKTKLRQRFVNRLTWLFYEHDEPYYPDY